MRGAPTGRARDGNGEVVAGSEDGVNEDAIGRKPMTEFLPPAFDQPRGQAADQPYLDTTAYRFSGPMIRSRTSPRRQRSLIMS